MALKSGTRSTRGEIRLELLVGCGQGRAGRFGKCDIRCLRAFRRKLDGCDIYERVVVGVVTGVIIAVAALYVRVGHLAVLTIRTALGSQAVAGMREQKTNSSGTFPAWWRARQIPRCGRRISRRISLMGH